MADISSNEDMALRYVLGELSDAQRREFESCLATNDELCACVNELEAGLVAAAATSPRHRPPSEIWQRIEKVVAKEARPKFELSALVFGWLRNGWAATALCLLGWLFYAIYAHHQTAAITEPSKNLQHEIARAHPAQPATVPQNVKLTEIAATNPPPEPSPAHMEEILALRGKIAGLQTQTAQLSRLLEQQRALLGESNRVKFCQLVSTTTTGNGNNKLPPSLDLQRAVLTALARELGWLGEPQTATRPSGNSVPMTVTVGGVDFIDLRPNSQNTVSQPVTTDNNAVQAQTQSTAQSQAETSSAENTNPSIPAYVSGDNLVVALDSTVVPMGSLVTLTTYDANQNQTGGSFVLGSNPAVVTVPFSVGGNTSFLTTGLGMVITFTSPAGQTGTYYFSQPTQSQTP